MKLVKKKPELTRCQILERVYNSKQVSHFLSKLNPEHLIPDLKQEVIIVMCNIPENKLKAMYKKRVLVFYFVRVALNMIMSNSSKFYTLYRQFSSKCEEIIINDFDRDYLNYEIDSNKSQDQFFFRKYRKHFIQINDIEIAQQELTYYNIINAILSEVENLNWYKKGMLNLYMEYGSFRKVGEKTKIPFNTCYKCVASARRQVIKSIPQSLLN